jgi:hypothetical protein
LSTSSITGTAVRDLAATITRQLDADKDGKLSVGEFEGFLTQFLGSLQSGTGSSGVSTQPLASLAATATNAATAAATTTRAKVGTMGGFDATKMANTEHKSAKYEVGRILQYYPNTPDGLRQALPEIQAIAPNAKIVGTKGDKIDFGGWVDGKGYAIGVVDVLQAAGIGGKAWQWIPD